MVRKIVVTVAYKVPDYGIGTVIVELMLAEAAHWDAALVGLRALLMILLNAPRASKGEVTHSMVSWRAPILSAQVAYH